jgi:hypothetical protein
MYFLIQKEHFGKIVVIFKLCNRHGRFGTMAGVAPQKRHCDFGSFAPSRALVSPATAPSRRDDKRII